MWNSSQSRHDPLGTLGGGGSVWGSSLKHTALDVEFHSGDRLRFAEQAWRERSPLSKLTIAAGFVLAYVAADVLTNYFEVWQGVTSLYLPVGIGFAFFLLYGRRWIGAFLAALIASSLTSDNFPIPLSTLVPMVLTKLVVYLGAAELVRWRGFDPLLRRPRDVGSVVLTALLAPIPVAVTAIYFVYPSREELLQRTVHFWMGDALAILAMAPLLTILWGERQLRRLGAGFDPDETSVDLRVLFRAPASWILVLATIATVAGAVALSGLIGISAYAVVLLPLIWAAIVGGVRGAALTVMLVITSSMWWQYVAQATPLEVVEAQIVVASLSIAVLFAGAATSSRRHALRKLAARETHLQAAESLASVTSFEWEPVSGNVAVASGLGRMIGHRHDERETRLDQILAAVHEADRGSFRAALMSAWEEGLPIDRIVRFVAGNEVREYQCRSTIRERGVRRVLVICRDVTEESALRAGLDQREREAKSLKSITNAIAWEATEKELEFDYVSPEAESLLGYPAESWYRPAFWINAIHPEDRTKVLAIHRKRDAARRLSVEYRMIGSKGETVWVRDVAEPAGGAGRLQGFLFDISDRRRVEAELQQIGIRDRLTGVANRALVTDRCGHALERLDDGGAIALLHVDLSRFKLINDSLGVRTGDELLREVASRLRGIADPADTIGRVSGDEFLVLLEREDRVGSADQIGREIVDRLTEPYEILGHTLHVDAYCGLSYGNRGDTADEVMRRADIALMHSKQSGNVGVLTFEQTMAANLMMRKRMEDDLRGAQERGELVAHFQPIVDLESGQVDGFEALLRWHHPTLGVLPPANLIAMAEETGAITEIDFVILRQACGRLADLRRTGKRESLSVSANLSGLHFRNRGLAARIAEILEECELPPSVLKLELTESVLIGDHEMAGDIMADLTGLGVDLRLDDFGTGYSSLVYLQSFPFASVKIDRSFVSTMTSESSSFEVVRSVIALCRTLEIDVIAEGVEELSQASALLELGCRRGQGFLYSPALPSEDLEEILRDHRFASAEPRR